MLLSGRVKVAAGAAVIALATPFIAGWEGIERQAYLDRIANPPVWTVCYGETDPKYAFDGASYTKSECVEMLRESVAEYYARIDGCMSDSVPGSVQASLLELAYNVGTSAVCKSTAMRKANAGDYAGACAELDKWVKAGGKTIKGLVNRRNASQGMCEADL